MAAAAEMWPGGPSSHKLVPSGKFIFVGPACSLLLSWVCPTPGQRWGADSRGASAHPPPPYQAEEAQVRKRDGHGEDGFGRKETLGPGAKILFGEKGKNERSACT